MAETFKDKAEQTGHKIAEAATKAGHKVGEKLEEAADWAKEKSHQMSNRVDEAAQKAEHRAQETFGGTASSGTASGIRAHMDVISSCGNMLGKVDHVEGQHLKLTKNDSPDGMHHLIPMSWVDRVDDHVHLSKNCGEVKAQWQTA